MRFGKKLALQVLDNRSGAPYLSHKPMKEAINKTVRELRIYQARAQGSEQAWEERLGGIGIRCSSPHVPRVRELAEVAEAVVAFDRELFELVDADLMRIREFVVEQENALEQLVVRLQATFLSAGFLMDDATAALVDAAVPHIAADRALFCKTLVTFRMRQDPKGLSWDLHSASTSFNQLVAAVNQHARYLEINVAGFRKLLKRHEKQIPPQFRSRPMPCLAFHGLVSKKSRTLLEITAQLGPVLQHIREVYVDIVTQEEAIAVATVLGPWPALEEANGFGPECHMVLSIQRQLKGGLPSDAPLGKCGDASPLQVGCVSPAVHHRGAGDAAAGRSEDAALAPRCGGQAINDVAGWQYKLSLHQTLASTSA